MKSAKTGFKTIDEYIASFPDEMQKILEEIRAIIRAAAPDVREKISYQIAGFELNGKNLIYFAGWKNHVSIYPIPSGDDELNQEVAPYVDGKGTLKFPVGKPLPLELIRRVAQARVTENMKMVASNSNKKNYD